jgi:ABC-type transport system involved in multi-copper enzyme maturation permease subunit
VTSAPDPGTGRLRLRQLGAVIRLELHRLLRANRLVAITLFNLAPVVVLLLSYLAPIAERSVDSSPAGLGRIFAIIFSTWMLRVAVFFTSAALSIQLFRTETFEKTAHYYLLAPVRRDVVVAGKLLTGVLASAVICCVAVAASYLALLGWMGSGMTAFFISGPGMAHLAAYLGVTVLGCLGYGAVFALAGVMWRNPILSFLALFGWETVLFLLPPFLKAISVLFYLESLLPVRPPAGPLAILAEPPPPLVSVLGALIFTAAVVALAAWRARGTEITYSTD